MGTVSASNQIALIINLRAGKQIALFLPTSREAKYKAKDAIDTFSVRMGDVLPAVVVFIGSYWLLNPKAFATINVALVAVSLLLVAVLGRYHKKLTLEEAKATA